MKRVEAIREHYLNGSELPLSDTDKEYERRLWLAYSILGQSDAMTTAGYTLQEGLKKEGIEVTFPTCLNYLRDAQLVFGPVLEYKLDFLKNLVVQQLINDIKDAEKMAIWALGEFNDNGEEIRPQNNGVWRTAKERKEKATLALIKATGIDKAEDEQIDFSQLEGNVYVVSVDDDFQKAALKMLESSGSVDLSEQFKTAIEEIEYEEIERTGSSEED